MATGSQKPSVEDDHDEGKSRAFPPLGKFLRAPRRGVSFDLGARRPAATHRIAVNAVLTPCNFCSIMQVNGISLGCADTSEKYVIFSVICRHFHLMSFYTI